MPGLLVNSSANIICQHGGHTTITSSNVRVKACGEFVALMNDLYTIAGCVQPASGIAGCFSIVWVRPAARIKVCGQPVLLNDSNGICQPSQVPPTIATTQPRVRGQ